MVKFGKTKIAKENFYAAKKRIKIWYVNVDNKVISKLVKTKTNSKYLIGYSEKDIRPLVLIMPKTSGYVKTFQVENKSINLCLSVKMLIIVVLFIILAKSAAINLLKNSDLEDCGHI